LKSIFYSVIIESPANENKPCYINSHQEDKAMSEKIRLAIIGCGMMSHNHVNGYREMKSKGIDTFDIVATCDVQEDRAKNIANNVKDFQGGVTPSIYTDLEKMLSAESLDAVDIVTSHNVHHTGSIACLEAGVNVVVEKPFAITVKAGKEMLETAKRSGKVLASAEPTRRDPSNRIKYWAINKAKLIGEPRMMFTQRVSWNLGVVVGTPWRHQKLYGGGGWIIDGEVHYIDFLRYVFGDVERVYAETRNFESTRYLDTQNMKNPIDSNVEDTAITVFTFESGFISNFVWTHAAAGKGFNLEKYYGSAGSIDNEGLTRNDGTNKTMAELHEMMMNDLSDNEKKQLFPHGITNCITIGLYDFLDALANNRPPEVTGYDGFMAQAICDAVYESAYLNQSVKILDVVDGKINNFQKEIDEYWGI
jgi:predicted dehydrogenase